MIIINIICMLISSFLAWEAYKDNLKFAFRFNVFAVAINIAAIIVTLS